MKTLVSRTIRAPILVSYIIPLNGQELSTVSSILIRQLSIVRTDETSPKSPRMGENSIAFVCGSSFGSDRQLVTIRIAEGLLQYSVSVLEKSHQDLHFQISQ